MEDEQRTRRRGLLKQYYGFSEENKEGFDPYSINAPEFNPDLFLHKLLKECNLSQLMQKESHIYKQIQSLDSEMQTLVYENYNKFISATDTIRKMKDDFKKMEEEMDCLSSNMSNITEFSGNISGTLQGRRQQISKLSGTHVLLKKLQFLFELPPGLKTCIENGSYQQAVRYYLKAQKVLHQYEHMPSFHGIQKDCDTLVNELKTKLREHFKSKDATPKQLAECIDLLLQLEEPTEILCDEFLKHAKEKLDVDLLELESRIPFNAESNKKIGDDDADCKQLDILEFIDYSYNNFVSNTSLVIASYWDLFLQKPVESESTKSSNTKIPMEKLENFVCELMDQYFNLIEKRFCMENSVNEDPILVRALDKFYRRVQAMNRLLPHKDFTHRGIQIVKKAAQDRCHFHLHRLQECFAVAMVTLRQSIVAPRTLSPDGNTNSTLTNILSEFESQIIAGVKTVQSDLQLFIQSDITFAMKTQFKDDFCRKCVREGVLIAFLKHVNKTCLEFCTTNEKNTVPPQLILLLSRYCFNLEQSIISELILSLDDKFEINSDKGLTSKSEICAVTKDIAQKLIDHFVNIQGMTISQMLRKSVETRDWLNALEPRNVRSVMKRVVEDCGSVDSMVGQLYEEGIRTDRSSDSSRRTASYNPARRRTHNTYAPSTIDNSLMSNIQKLFSEKIEIFTSVEFSKVSVMTGIIKISLKTFLECVRQRTFGKFGLQQVQVDIHYLQLYLWHFVADENLIHVLLDEILSSTANRSLDPVLMEPSVVDVICERG